MNQSRRKFLKATGGCLTAGMLLNSFKTWGASSALSSQGSGQYQALVCIFLYGGNDGNNMIIPYDAYADYNAVRNTTAQLNIPKSDLLQIKAASQGNQMFGLHPDMPELQSIYQSGNLAVLCNVGTLVQPVTRSQYLAGGVVPDQLFSHADQQNQWQTGTTDSYDTLALTGWGGRTADALTAAAKSGQLPMVITFAGNTPFTLGVQTQPFEPGQKLSGFPSQPANSPRYQALQAILTETDTAALVNAANRDVTSAIANSDFYNTALNPAPVINTVFPGNSLGSQLLDVAKTIAARKPLGAQQQIFFVSLGGFDTHTSQLATQGGPVRNTNSLLSQVSQAMSAFYEATNELGVANLVTTFTMSEFARTLQPNTGGGTDHAWGNHHFILGGAVKGGDFYGKFPKLALAGPDDATAEGRWIPTTSVDQYAATLTTWFGLNSAELQANFPSLKNFSSQNLGFLG
jgi:uncharacterized protein (DUF1501 family)